MIAIIFRLFKKNTSLLLSPCFRLSDELCSRKIGQVDSIRQIFPRENPHMKHMGVGAHGKRHCKRSTTYSTIVYWFLAIVNDQITTNRCFLGNFDALSSNLTSFLLKNAPRTIVLGCTEITWRCDHQTTSSMGMLQNGIDARFEKLHFEPHNC